MGHMGVGHEKNIISENCFAAAAGRSPVNSHKLAEGIVIADYELGPGIRLELQVLGNFTDGAELKNSAPLANGGKLFNHHMGPHSGVVANPDLIADQGIGPDLNTGADFSAFADDGSLMYGALFSLCHRSSGLINGALQTRNHAAVATPAPREHFLP
jgi:hypothetical protein